MSELPSTLAQPSTSAQSPTSAQPSASTTVENFLASLPLKREDLEEQIIKKKKGLRKIKRQKAKQEEKFRKEAQKLKSLTEKKKNLNLQLMI